jgi:predicted DNA-binding transcriptional regulator AlpA
MSKQNISIEDLHTIFKDSLLAQKRVFNLKDLMSYTGWSDKNIYRLTSLSLIPFTKPTKGSLFFDRLKIEEWLLSNSSPTNQEVDDLVNRHLFKNK